MKSSNMIMAKSKGEPEAEAGISQEKIQELHRERKRKEAEKRKKMGCWNCGKKLTIWDYDLGVSELATDDVEDDRDSRIQHIKDMVKSITKEMRSKEFEIPDGFRKVLGKILMTHFYPVRLSYIGTNPKLCIGKKKIAGLGYLCYRCKSEAEETEMEEKCFMCGKKDGSLRACGVHLCDVCTAPKITDITDIMSPNGDGSMVDQDMIAWWRGATHLQNCVIDAEVFRFTLDTELLARIYGEVGVVGDQGIINDDQREAINEVIKSITEEMKKDENEAAIMAAGLRGVLGEILMKHLYYDHPMKKADIQLEPGVYELEGERPDGLDTFRWTVKDAPVVLKRIEEETHPPADDDEAEDTKETDDDKGD